MCFYPCLYFWTELGDIQYRSLHLMLLYIFYFHENRRSEERIVLRSVIEIFLLFCNIFVLLLIKIGTEDVTRNAVDICNFVK